MKSIYANAYTTGLLCGIALMGIILLGILMIFWKLQAPLPELQSLKNLINQKRYFLFPRIDLPNSNEEKDIQQDQLLTNASRTTSSPDCSDHCLPIPYEEELAQGLDALPIAVTIHKPDGSMVYCNPMARQLLQREIWDAVELSQLTTTYQIYQAGTDTLYPTERLPVVRALQGEQAKADDLEIRLHQTVIPLEVLGKPILDEQGAVTYAIAVFQDITERKRAEQVLADYSRQLELEVKQQTVELAQVKEQLQQEIQEREQAEASVHYSQELLKRIADSVPAGIAYIDAERRYQFVNKVYEIRFKRPRETMIAQHVWEVIGQDLYNRVKNAIDHVLQGEPTNLEFDVTYEGDTQRYFSALLSPDLDAAHRVIGYCLIFFDITERKCLEESLKKANNELECLATLDSLTQIANRRKFDEYLLQEWQRLTRTQNALSLILFDVDYFKRYNDCYGHQAGDACLMEIAQAAQRSVNRATDLVTRYGGEEFAVILPNTNHRGAIAVAERIRQAIRALAITHEQSDINEIVTISLGIASVTPTAEMLPDELLALADQALYTAKQQGRDRYSAGPLSE